MIEDGGGLIHQSVLAAVPVPLPVERVRWEARGLQALDRGELLRLAQWLVVGEDPPHIICLIRLSILAALVEVRSRVPSIIEVAGFRVLLILGEGAVWVHHRCIGVLLD
jgi:hypothetical protein